MHSQLAKAKLEDLWRIRLEQAVKRHQFAKANRLKVLEEFTSGLTVPPDGSQAVKRATMEENAAREDYLRTLKIFADLVLRRTVPPDE